MRLSHNITTLVMANRAMPGIHSQLPSGCCAIISVNEVNDAKGKLMPQWGKSN